MGKLEFGLWDSFGVHEMARSLTLGGGAGA